MVYVNMQEQPFWICYNIGKLFQLADYCEPFYQSNTQPRKPSCTCLNNTFASQMMTVFGSAFYKIADYI